MVIGDMNICSTENPNNLLKTCLEAQAFKLIVKKATHIEGGHIDQVYILKHGNYEAKPDVEIVPKYYTDHDAICICWKKKQGTLMQNEYGGQQIEKGGQVPEIPLGGLVLPVVSG